MDKTVYILEDRKIRVEWTILKGTSPVREDFRRALVKVFLIGNCEKYLLEATADRGTLMIDIPEGLEPGLYSLEAIWVKNAGHPGRHDRDLCRSMKQDLFAITEFEEEATNLPEGTVVLKAKSSTATYGYDGLSSYELAVLRGEWNGTEGEWLKHQRYVSVLDGRGDSDVDTMSQKSITEELVKHDTAIEGANKEIDTAQTDIKNLNDEMDEVQDRLAYIPKESFLSSEPACDYHTEDNQDELTVSRAIKDRFGRIIDEHYVTRETVKDYTQEVVDGSKLEIQPGSVQPEDLSPAVQQMIESAAAQPGHITNLPDEEDLTVTEHNTLQFKDREYNPYNYSGMGKVYLRKHIVNGTNMLTQHMMNKPNTIYVIRYDYCLGGETIEVPEGCVLEFDGGSLRNGKIVGCNTAILASLQKILDVNIFTAGTWNVKEAYPEWFGARTNDKNIDCTKSIQKCLDSFDITRLQNATYYIYGNKTIEIPQGKSLFGCNKPIMETTYNIELVSYERPIDDEFIVLKLNNNTEIKNISIKGVDGKKGLIGIGSDTIVSRVYVKDSICTNFDIGIRLKCYLSKIYNSQVRYCNIGFEIRNMSDEDPVNITSTVLIGCYASDCYQYGYRIIRLTYGTIIGCAADRCGIDSRIDISERVNNMGYPYYFQQCYGCSMINCGTEGSANILYTVKLQGFSVKNCIFVISGRYFDDSNFDYSRLINFINPVNVEFDKNCIERSNANISRSPKFIYVYNDDSIYDNYTILKINQIALSIPYLNNLWRGIELDGDYCSTANVDVESGLKKKGDYDTATLYEINLESGRQFYDTKRHALLIWDSNSWRYAEGNKVSASHYGNLENLPNEEDITSGFIYWCTDYLSPILWNGNSWRTFDGFAPALKQGSSLNRPVFESTSSNRGFNYWDGNMQKPIWWSSSGWIMADGNPADAKRFGDTNSKPNLSKDIVGFCYFDTVSKKPIWWTGSHWVDATGSQV